MRELSGLEYEEIAVVLDSSSAAAKQSVYDARLALHDRRQGRETSCARARRAVRGRPPRASRATDIRPPAHLRRLPRLRAQLWPSVPPSSARSPQPCQVSASSGSSRRCSEAAEAEGAEPPAAQSAGAGAAGAVSASTFNAAAAFTTLAVATGFVASDRHVTFGRRRSTPRTRRGPHGRYLAPSAFAGDLRSLSTHAAGSADPGTCAVRRGAILRPSSECARETPALG